MKIWFPNVIAGSGADIYVQLLARGLRALGCETVITPIPHRWQYFPWRLKHLTMPPGTDVILANSWNGFAFAHFPARLVVIEHHCIFDPAYLPYRSFAQAVFHETLVRHFERASFARADRVVTVSHYTAASLKSLFGVDDAQTIHNGIDTDFFTPAAQAQPAAVQDRLFRLLFVGNPMRRKGADLLLPIMRELGPGFELRYTSGLRDDEHVPDGLNVRCIGRLDDHALREEYRNADLLLFPSRLEGFGYAAVEAMACGTAVVSSNSSSLPEIVEDGVTGSLAQVDDVEAFAAAIRALRDDRDRLARYSAAGRERVLGRFALSHMSRQYLELFEQLTG